MVNFMKIELPAPIAIALILIGIVILWMFLAWLSSQPTMEPYTQSFKNWTT